MIPAPTTTSTQLIGRPRNTSRTGRVCRTDIGSPFSVAVGSLESIDCRQDENDPGGMTPTQPSAWSSSLAVSKSRNG